MGNVTFPFALTSLIHSFTAEPAFFASPPASSEAKRIKLTVPQQNQGASPVDPENAPGKRSELDPIQGGDIANLPPAEASTSAAPAAPAAPPAPAAPAAPAATAHPAPAAPAVPAPYHC